MGGFWSPAKSWKSGGGAHAAELAGNNFLNAHCMASWVVKGDLSGVVRWEERDYFKRQGKQFVCEGTPHGLLKVLQNSGWGGVFLKHLKVVNLKGYNTLLDVSNYTGCGVVQYIIKYTLGYYL